MDDDSTIRNWTRDVHCGDAREKLREMSESSVHTVITSPPYFNQRDYQIKEQIGVEDKIEKYVNRLPPKSVIGNKNAIVRPIRRNLESFLIHLPAPEQRVLLQKISIDSMSASN